MCELFAMTAERPAVVDYTLDRFAQEGGERHRNRDGWGMMFAEERDAHVFREASPASDSPLAKMVVERDIPCRHLIAHVRRASRGKPHLANTHPFTRVHAGRAHHFAHNGTLRALDERAGDLRANCVGDTDSELAFLILMRALEDVPHGPEATEQRFHIFARFSADMAQLGSANFVFFDGETLFAHAHKRIYETETGLTPPKPPGLSIRHLGREPKTAHWHGPGAHIRDLPRETILLASVPLNDEGWAPLPEGCVLALRDGVLLHQQGADNA
ncbi:class II glutamine amidotransferase [Aquicoccus sp. G2-2]|uniref:class II glutamine amidotransferase n=1 Tax=Aquicoccus sp. G2-2 TaxID=3092120 RepID=UPI002ADFE3D2|nr:class II glutamine amidotransferase [Aquicoccus sp. G2-2]MEA1114865.1 class II glutamine amidotransferase [Aquicoccus sp. G2-2]